MKRSPIFDLGILLLSLFTASCNQNTSKAPSTTNNPVLSGDAFTILDPVLNQQALSILQGRCASCHGSSNVANINYITNVNSLVNYGLVVPGNSSSSRLYLRVADGTMPPAGAMPNSELDTLKRWIDEGLETNSAPVTPPAASIAFAPGTSALTQQAVTLLSTRCESCHNSASGATLGGGILDMRDPAIIIATGLAFSGKASQSPLYLAISANRMPKGGTLSATEKTLIKNWIDTDLAANSAALVGDTVPVLKPTFSSINQIILSTRCVLCHGGPLGTKEGVNVSTYAATKSAANKIYNSIKGGDMPRNFPRLTSGEIAAFKGWMDAGMPNN
jgi:cytochrome c553